MKPALDREQARAKADTEQRRKIFVGGLPKNLSDDKLEEYFSRFGFVQKCYVVKDAFTGKTRGFGFVIFGTQEGFEAVLDAPDHFIEGQEIHIKPAQARDDELGEEIPEEIPRGREQNKKKQVRQSKMNLQYQSESFSPNARNNRGNPKRGTSNYYQNPNFDGGNAYPSPYGFEQESDHHYNQNTGYSPDMRYGFGGNSRGGHKQGTFGISDGAASHGHQQYENSRKPQNFSSYQESAYTNSPITYQSEHSHLQNQYPRNGYPDQLISPVSAKRNPRQERNYPDTDQGSPQNGVQNSMSFSPKSRQPTAESFSRHENQFMKPTKVTQLQEHDMQPVPYTTPAKDGFSQPYKLSNQLDESQAAGKSPQVFQSTPLNNRSAGGFSNPVRSANKHFSGLQQIPENESQKLSGEHVSQSTNRVNQHSNHNPVLQSNPGSQLEDDLPQESDHLIEDFHFFGQSPNPNDPQQKVSPTNQPDSLRLQSRNQLSNSINYGQAGDSLMGASSQYPLANVQNPGRFIASSSNVILHNGMPRPDNAGSGQAVKPQFSHKQIIQSSQKQGYSMFAPTPTPLAPGFQRSNDGGSGTQIRKKTHLHSDRTISHEDMFKKQAQLSPAQQAAKLHYYAGNMHYAPMNGMSNVADPRSPLNQQTPVHAYSPPNGGLPDPTGHGVRPPFSNAIYTRINHPAKVFHRSEQAIGHSQSHNVWPAQEHQNGPVYHHHQPPGSTPFVDKHATQPRRTHLDGNVCIPIDEDGDYDDQELQKATDF